MASTGLNSSVQEADATARAGIVVGLTSFNDIQTIAAVARALREGVARSFASANARFVLADAGSTDRTRDVVRDIIGPSALVEVDYERGAFDQLAYHGYPARAAAVRAVLRTAQRLSARACAVIDTSLHTVEPGWIDRLVGPVMADGFDYVSPYYARHVHEGAITRGIVYPMFRALYGVQLRQPIATEFGCSERLVAHFLEQDFWEAQEAATGIDLWLAATAVTGDFRVCEAVLGRRGAAVRGTPADLTTTLAQVVGALFADLEHRVDVWQRVRGSTAVPAFGSAPAIELEAPPLEVHDLMESFRLGYRELREVWTWVLPPRTILELRRLTEAPADRFRFDDRLWATIVYDFALGYSLRVLPRDHLRRSLAPLYSGWLASFVLQMRNADLASVQERVEQVCLGFESEKRYLISRWRWPERLR
jgi:hypothetical protein